MRIWEKVWKSVENLLCFGKKFLPKAAEISININNINNTIDKKARIFYQNQRNFQLA